MAKQLHQCIKNYRLNKFIIKIEVPDGWMLCNTTTGSVIFIHEDEDLSKSLDELIRMYYYVPMDFDEIKWVDKLRASKILSAKETFVNGFTVFTTMDCNARCFYCYEKGQPKITMSEKVARDTADYIMRMSSNHPVRISWFGGEPLVNIRAIDVICERLIDSGCKFRSSMVSNGLLFSESVITKAKNLWNLKKVQITLDGTRDTYQLIKSYKASTGNEFERVTSNIRMLLDANIRVVIRLNQDINNTQDLLNLVDFLLEKFRGEKLFHVYNNLLFEDETEPTAQNEKERYEVFKILQHKLIESGLLPIPPLKKKLKLHSCMADNSTSVIITPKGDVGKCEHFTDQHIVGTIYDTQFDDAEVRRCKERYMPTSKCSNCPLYPQCLRLKVCPQEKESCSQTQCENKIELIQRALMNKYQSMKRKNGIGVQ